jgi:hypothetical protein
MKSNKVRCFGENVTSVILRKARLWPAVSDLAGCYWSASAMFPKLNFNAKTNALQLEPVLILAERETVCALMD